MITKTCLVFAASALVVGVAAAQTLSGLTGNDREPPSVSEPQMQLTRPQIDRQENNGASQREARCAVRDRQPLPGDQASGKTSATLTSNIRRLTKFCHASLGVPWPHAQFRRA